MYVRILISLMLLLGQTVLLEAQYISEVFEYKPAPGQLINKSPWGLPESAQSIKGDINGTLTLGAFGGYVVFRFENPVQNHPDNPFGVDFTIFGNPTKDWSEPGILWVMKDENGNGKPDGTWYELAGSDYFFSSTIHDYEVSYTNPEKENATDVPWDDNQGGSGFVLANSAHSQPYYPSDDYFTNINPDTYTLKGTLIQGKIEKDSPPLNKSFRRAFGYVDNHFRGDPTSRIPGNPYTVAVENAGGDGFDISWAVDENGNYVNLDEIHFIKVQTAMQANVGWLGEVSTEITGAMVTQPNSSITGIVDMIVIKDLPNTINTPEYQLEAFAYHKGRVQWNEKIFWDTNQEGAKIDEHMLLTLTQSGEITLTAWLERNPDIKATASAFVDLSGTQTSVATNSQNQVVVFPNPAKNAIHIDVVEYAEVIIYNLTGSKVMEISGYLSGKSINISEIPTGVYLLQIIRNGTTEFTKLVKK